jgi:hypothetical protein
VRSVGVGAGNFGGLPKSVDICSRHHRARLSRFLTSRVNRDTQRRWTSTKAADRLLLFQFLFCNVEIVLTNEMRS